MYVHIFYVRKERAGAALKASATSFHASFKAKVKKKYGGLRACLNSQLPSLFQMQLQRMINSH